MYSYSDGMKFTSRNPISFKRSCTQLPEMQISDFKFTYLSMFMEYRLQLLLTAKCGHWQKIWWKKKKGEVIHVLFYSKKSGLYLMCTQENSETPREASSCSSLGSTRKTLHFLQVPLWFWEFDIRSAAVQDISQEKQSSKVYLGKKKSDYRRKAVQNLNGFTWSIWTWLQTEWVAWWISLSSSGFQVHRCEYIKTENRFGNSDHNWKSEIPLLQKWKEMFGRPEQNTAFQHFLVSRNCQQYSVGSVEMFTERTIKSG